MVRVAICIVFLFLGTLLQAQDDTQNLYKLEDSYTSTVSFGSVVDISSNKAIVGAHLDDKDQSCLYIFQKDNNLWKQTAELFLDNNNFFDQSSISAAIDNSTAVVGLRWSDVNGNKAQGIVYVFEEKGAWQQVAKLIPDDAQASDLFGSSVAISGNTIIVGAPGLNTEDDENSPKGAAYIFTKQAGVWQQTIKLQAGIGKGFDSFGNDVDIYGDSAIVADKSREIDGKTGQGTVYVYKEQGNNWIHSDKLIAKDGKTGDNFGSSIAIGDGIMVVGAEGYNYGNQVSQGVVYIFKLRDSEWGWGSNWEQVAKLVAKDGKGGDHFGSSVDVDNNRIIVGAYLDDVALDGYFQGSAYIFEESFGVWEESTKLIAEDGARGDNFGNAVAISGENIIVGAHSADVDGKIDHGRAYGFTFSLLQITQAKEEVEVY